MTCLQVLGKDNTTVQQTLAAGAFFGDKAMMGSAMGGSTTHWRRTVQAVTHSELMVLNRKDCRQLISMHPDFAWAERLHLFLFFASRSVPTAGTKGLCRSECA